MVEGGVIVISEIATATSGLEEGFVLILVVLALVTMTIVASLLLRHVFLNSGIEKGKYIAPVLIFILAVNLAVALDLVAEIGYITVMKIAMVLVLGTILMEFAFWIYDHQKVKHATM